MAQYSELDDLALVKAVLDKEPGAFDELYARCKPTVLAATFSLCAQDDQEDIAQIVFERLLRKLGLFNGTSQLATWVYKLARNTAVNELPRNALPVVSLADVDPTAAGDSSLDRIENEEALIRLREAIARLPEAMRVVVHMRLKETPWEAIAIVLEKPLGTVKSLYFRATGLLREDMLPMKERVYGA